MKLPIASNRTVVRKVLALLNMYRGEFVLVVSMQLLVAFAAVVTPWVIGKTFDAVAGGASAAQIKRYIGVILVAVVVQFAAEWFADYRSRVLGQKVFNVMRIQLVESVMHLPLSVVESAGTGDLLGRTTSDISRVEFVVRMGIFRLLVLALQVVMIVVAALTVEWRVGFVVLLAFVPLALVIRRYLRRTIAAYLASSALSAELSGDIAETVEQSATVDAFAMADSRTRRTSVLLREQWDNERYTALMRALFSASIVVILFSPIILAVAWGAWLVGAGITTVGAVISVALYAQQMRGPLDEIGWWIDSLQYAAVAFARIFGVAEVQPDREASSQVPAGKRVDVVGVDFAYREGEPVLRGVNLSVKEGERLAIVGPSGAGKSTLGRLISGVNPPDRGSVRIGGAEVVGLPEDLMHRTVALVTQENHVFVGTIADNLRFAKAEAGREELAEALASVGADWVSRLPDGMDTEVGSGAHELAPAEAQQLALARIVLLDPDVVILDEATSLLDPNAARSAEQALARVLAGRTVISIAHRLYTAYDADRVAVMIDGEVAELGSHDELVALGGQYAALWEAWQQG